MELRIDRAGTLSLAFPEDFSRLKAVVAAELPAFPARLRHIFPVVGDTHAFFAPAELRAFLADGRDEEWLGRFDRMLAGAAKAGFVDAEGRVRVHIERAA